MLTGEPFLKQRAYDYWFGGSNRGYNATKMHDLGGVGDNFAGYYLDGAVLRLDLILAFSATLGLGLYLGLRGSQRGSVGRFLYLAPRVKEPAGR